MAREKREKTSRQKYSLFSLSKRKKQERINLPEKEKKQCMTIIHGASATCGGLGTGMAQIPLADNAVITPIQISMIVALGKVFGLSITKAAARGIIVGAGASLIGRGVSQLLWGWIPFIGNAINTATAAGLTEAIGWMAVDQFARESAGESITIQAKSNSSSKAEEVNDPGSMSCEELKRRICDFLEKEVNSETYYEELTSLIHEVEANPCEDDEYNELWDKLLERYNFKVMKQKKR